MTDLVSTLQQTGALSSIARQLGVDEATATRGAGALLPAILGGFKKQAGGGAGGLDGLAGMLGGLGGGGLLDAVLSSGDAPAGRGNDVLGQIFGSKEVSRTVAGQAAGATGLDSGLLKQMLPLLAMAVAGYMAKQGAGAGAKSGGLGGMLGQVLGGLTGGGKAAPQGGLGGLASMLDLNGDGNPLDDIIGMAGKLGGR
ncbi:DUF937 domain-containing protein [Sphingosinicella microcystinivorans]|uniref:DUF937 domain-containing protein n=1 Tax=Sphingosinicella microcystinivorans TaxID=335406 RepID=UPI0022F3F5D5|nr:DUF937 domain-containing protein [Sphingosinicella microcystinivorans]WBX85074.1 DUF937 domain-containing protein [Sphingosinicella microcystinivorans]